MGFERMRGKTYRQIVTHMCVFTNLGLISIVLIDVLQFYIAYWYDRENSPVFKCS